MMSMNDEGLQKFYNETCILCRLIGFRAFLCPGMSDDEIYKRAKDIADDVHDEIDGQPKPSFYPEQKRGRRFSDIGKSE